MKKIIIISSLILLIAAPVLSSSFTQGRLLGNILTEFLGRYHFTKKKLDDKLSQKAVDQFIKRLDYRKQFFLQSDVDKILTYKNKLDDQVRNGKYDIVTTSYDLLNKRLGQVKGMAFAYLDNEIDYDKSKLTIETDSEKRKFSKNEKKLKEFWHNYLKLAVMNEIFNLEEQQKAELEAQAKEEKDKNKKKDKEKSKKIVKKTFDQIEKEARENIKKSYVSFFKRLQGQKEIDQISTLMNSLSSVYDPHTTYFPPRELEDFNINISGKLEGIGAVLSQDGAYTKVERIVPGSPSWKQKELEVGDTIIKVGQGKKDPTSIVGMDLRDAVRLIRGKKGSEVNLTVKKKLDSSVKIIPIVRDVVELEEGYAKGVIINHKKINKKIGYITLPSFYRDFNPKKGQAPRNCTEDVEKLLVEFNKQGVEGLVFDVRNNGGGSLQDAVDMAGLFFKRGPVVQVKDHQGNIEIHKDTDARVVFKKPVVVLQNGFSASASEILAGALKDYDRALVVGSPASHGKGTVQTIIDLDKQVPPLLLSNLLGGDTNASLGALKLTIQKFYRVNGSSTQNKGVEPNIAFPDQWDFMESGERYLDYSLPWEEIKAANYTKWPAYKYDVKKLRKLSEKRRKENEGFQKITKRISLLKKYKDQTSKPLNLKALRNDREKREKDLKDLETDTKNTDMVVTNYVSNLTSKISKSKNKKRLAEAEEARKDDFTEQIQKDVYLEEAIFIMGDVLSSKEYKKVEMLSKK